MASIKQNPPALPVALPDFRNLGFCLRTLVFANLMGLAAALVRTSSLPGLWQEVLSIASVLQPLVLASLLVLYACNPLLGSLPYRQGVAAVLVLETGITALLWMFNRYLFGAENVAGLGHWCLLSLMASGSLLVYFNLRSRALSPALTEARLQALQARIRPHFLFNSLNAVLALIRDDPRRAETALEDMADLFRVLMADNRQLVPLDDELALCRKYLDLEKLRLGHRLRVVWDTTHQPEGVMIPPLVLQPLLENAVYYGIEPSEAGGEILIKIGTWGDQARITLTNPYCEGAAHHASNHMAIDNIRERLALHFDYEASLSSKIENGQYRVDILLPCRK
ncbi:MAG: histidine kinase [Methylophilaceae bacterium]|nr:histidine kinase [Methylophilaceae bacterium]